MFGVPKLIARKMVIKLCLEKDLYQLLKTSILDWPNKKSEK